jgi:hypothetical protein
MGRIHTKMTAGGWRHSAKLLREDNIKLSAFCKQCMDDMNRIFEIADKASFWNFGMKNIASIALPYTDKFSKEVKDETRSSLQRRQIPNRR